MNHEPVSAIVRLGLVAFLASLGACLARGEIASAGGEQSGVLRWTFDDAAVPPFAPYHCTLSVDGGVLVVAADGRYSSPSLGSLVSSARHGDLLRLMIRARVDGPSSGNDLLVYVNDRAIGVGLTDAFEIHVIDLLHAHGWKEGDENSLALRWSHCSPTAEDRVLIDWIAIDLGAGKPPAPKRDDPRPAPPRPAFEVRPEWRDEHPFLAERIWSRRVPDLKERAAKLLAMADEDIVPLVPTRSPIATRCPKCREQTKLEFLWDAEHANRFRCTKCGLTLPNAAYPEDGEERVTNLLGEEVVYRFHVGAGGERFYLSGTAAFDRHRFFTKNAERLARLYHAEKDEALAGKVALILDRYAQVTPSYCVVGARLSRRPRQPFSNAAPPYPYSAGRFSTWWYTEVPFELLVAYDLTYHSPAYDALSKERGVDVRARIEKDLFLNTANVLLTRYPFELGNMTPITATRFVALGRTIGCPDMVHMGAWLASGMAMSQYFHDGFWKEGTISYHTQTTGRLHETIIHLQGYTDPPGYTDTAFGLTLKDVDLEADFPFQKISREIHKRFTMPDGRYAAIHDTHFRPPGEVSATAVCEPRIFPGFGHAVLGRGKGPNQMEAHLHFDDGMNSHAHGDALNLILFAKEREMMSDIGYGRGVLRYFTTGALSHNVLLVDRRGPRLVDGPECALRRLELATPGVQLVEADGHRAFGHDLSAYSRALLLVELSEEDAYVVDLFRARGGTVHELLLHGDADRDMVRAESAGFEKKSGTYYGRDFPYSTASVPGRITYGGLIDDLRALVTSDTWWAEWRYAEDREVGVRTTVLGWPDTQAMVGRAPSIRRSKHLGVELAREEHTYKMPMMVVRRHRDTAGPFEDTFTSVIEPFRGNPSIRFVAPLRSDDAGPFDVGLSVASARGVDRVVSSRRVRPLVWSGAGGELCAACAFGLMRTGSNGALELLLCGGTELAAEGLRLETAGDAHLPVVRTIRGRMGEAGAIVLTGVLPQGDALSKRWLLVTHPDKTTHGYEIRSVERQGQESIVQVARDPGFEIGEAGESRWLYYPPRELRGQHVAMVPATVHLSIRGEDARLTCTTETRVRFTAQVRAAPPEVRRDAADARVVVAPAGEWRLSLAAGK